MFSDNDGLKSFKLCLDGKKVNISSISLLGGVVLFGFEDKATAQDRKDRLKKEESMIYLINNVLKKFFEKDLLDLNGCPDKYSNDCTELLGLMKDVMRLLNLRISYLRPLRVKKYITLQKLKEIWFKLEKVLSIHLQSVLFILVYIRLIRLGMTV